MSNVGADRRVESDWWAQPIPPNVDFGEGFYCETAQVFRFMRNQAAHALRFGNHVSVYAGCSFALGANGSAVVGDFTLLNGALVMAEEQIEIWGDGSAVRDFVYIDDVVDALELASRDQSDFRIFNISCGEGHSLREIVSRIQTLLGKELKLVWKNARPSDVSVSIVSNVRAREVLGWAPKATLDEGLEKTIAWWRAGAR